MSCWIGPGSVEVGMGREIPSLSPHCHLIVTSSHLGPVFRLVVGWSRTRTWTGWSLRIPWAQGIWDFMILRSPQHIWVLATCRLWFLQLSPARWDFLIKEWNFLDWWSPAGPVGVWRISRGAGRPSFWRQHPPATALHLLSCRTWLLSTKNRGKKAFIGHIHEILLPKHPAWELSWLNYPKKQKGGSYKFWFWYWRNKFWLFPVHSPACNRFKARYRWLCNYCQHLLIILDKALGLFSRSRWREYTIF